MKSKNAIKKAFWGGKIEKNVKAVKWFCCCWELLSIWAYFDLKNNKALLVRSAVESKTDKNN